MAAHSVNILIEMAREVPWVASKVKEFVSRYKSALDYAPGMDEISLDDYRTLHGALDALNAVPDPSTLRKDTLDIVLSVLSVQLVKWGDLNMPESHEQWMRAKYPPEN